MLDEPRVRIEILSAWIVRVEVRRSSGDFGLHRDGSPPSRPGIQTYQLGYRDAPLYRLEVRPGPREAWEIAPLSKGRCLERLEAFEPEVPQAYLDWFVESGELQGVALPWLLPVGRYFLVQTSRPLYSTRWMRLGGANVITSPNFFQLRSQKTFYSVVFGAERTRPPEIDQPLVGLVLPNYLLEDDTMHGLFFFSFSRTDRVPREREAGSGYLLVVPIEGSLVLEPEGLVVAGESPREAWTEALARRFADWCARLTEEWRER